MLIIIADHNQLAGFVHLKQSWSKTPGTEQNIYQQCRRHYRFKENKHPCVLITSREQLFHEVRLCMYKHDAKHFICFGICLLDIIDGSIDGTQLIPLLSCNLRILMSGAYSDGAVLHFYFWRLPVSKCISYNFSKLKVSK